MYCNYLKLKTKLSKNMCLTYVCLFVIFVPLENFSLIWRRHHCRWSAANFDLCSALMVIEQWGFYSVSYLLWHGASVCNGYLRGPVTLTHCRAFDSEALITCFYDLGLSLLGFEHPTFRLQDERSNRLRPSIRCLTCN